ncbi:hypothetical protein KA093_02535, partial [Candidatus Saccharibacteria bacterium]|nr:hypothetical protein [Candidatus Saccharibacteria bacterium]
LAEAGDRVTVGNIVLPQGVEIVEHSDGHADEDEETEKPSIMDLVVASVYEPSALQAANEAAAGAAQDESEVAAEGEQESAEVPASDGKTE